MTNNSTLLSRRRLPPLTNAKNKNPKLPYNLEFLSKASTLESLQHYDLPQHLIKEYLDKNPQFLDNYIMNNQRFRTSFNPISPDAVLTEKNDTSYKSSSIHKSPPSLHQSKDIIFNEEFVTRASADKKTRSILNRELFILKLMNNFDESIPKASIIKSLYECMMESMQLDQIKIYLTDAKRENLYLYDPMKMNQEVNATETYSLIRIQSPAAMAAVYNECVMYSNMQQNVHLRKFKSDFNIMAQPITHFTGSVFGAVELLKDRNKGKFTKVDEDIVLNYITWTSITLYFCEILARNSTQQQLNEVIMQVTQTMFTNFRHMDNVIMDIMRYTKQIVKAQRSAFFTVDKEAREIIAQIFDIGTEFETQFVADKEHLRLPMGVGIVGHVAETGEALNIKDAYDDLRFNRDVDIKTGYHTKSLLAIPIKLKNEVVGVLQIVNKTDGYFTRTDEENLETFGSYCGIALYISKMYKRIKQSEQKYKVALGVLSYHSGYDQEEFLKLDKMFVPSSWPNISDYYFNAWDMDEMKQVVAFMSMFQDLFGIYSLGQNNDNITETRLSCLLYRFDKTTLMKFILTVKKNYRKVPYHNWSHGFSVGHAMYCILVRTSHKFTVIESLALFISCFCHDLDHRGLTNEFISKSDVALGSLYSTSVMENHHFNMTVQILQRDDHNIFQNMISVDYKAVLDLMKSNILATDLNLFFGNVAKIKSIVAKDEIDWNNYDQRLLFMELCMTASDLCAMCKPWDMQLNFVRVIMEEFWEQGDLEKARGEVPARMMDREYSYELADLEIGFIAFICVPCYSTLNQIFTGFTEAINGVEKNLAQWKIVKTLPKEEIIELLS